jgi:hypothetical protein
LAVISPIIKTIKSLKDATLAPINGGDLANGQFTKLLDNSSIGKPLGSFYLYDYAGFDPENGKMLYTMQQVLQ